VANVVFGLSGYHIIVGLGFLCFGMLSGEILNCQELFLGWRVKSDSSPIDNCSDPSSIQNTRILAILLSLGLGFTLARNWVGFFGSWPIIGFGKYAFGVFGVISFSSFG